MEEEGPALHVGLFNQCESWLALAAIDSYSNNLPQYFRAALRGFDTMVRNLTRKKVNVHDRAFFASDMN